MWKNSLEKQYKYINTPISLTHHNNTSKKPHTKNIFSNPRHTHQHLIIHTKTLSLKKQGIIFVWLFPLFICLVWKCCLKEFV